MAKKGKTKHKHKNSKSEMSSFSDMDSTAPKVIIVGSNGEGSVKTTSGFSGPPKQAFSPTKSNGQEFSISEDTLKRMKLFINYYKSGDVEREFRWKDYIAKEANDVFTSNFLNDATKSCKLIQILKTVSEMKSKIRRDNSNLQRILSHIRNKKDELLKKKENTMLNSMTEQLKKFCETTQSEIELFRKQKEEAQAKANQGVVGIKASLIEMRNNYTKQLNEEVKKMNEINMEKIKIESEVYSLVKDLIHPQAKDFYDEVSETKIVEKTVEILKQEDNDANSVNKIKNYILKMKVRNKLGLKLSKWVHYTKLPKELVEREDEKEKEVVADHVLLSIPAGKKSQKKNKKR